MAGDETVEDINAAWDAVEADAEEVLEEAVEEEAQDAVQPEEQELTESPSEGEPQDGDETPGTEASTDEAAVREDEEPSAKSDDEPPRADAPVSWSAAAREHWGNIPKEAQDYIKNREHEYELGIRKHAENAKRAEQMDNALAPFQQFFALNGGQPAQTIGGILQTASVLQMGSPLQKAQTMANMIRQFGVDVGALDKILVGEDAPEGVQQQDSVQQAIQRAMQPYQAMFQELQQSRQSSEAALDTQAQSDVETFASDPKNEFYNDVSSDMADILDLAARRNADMTLKEAYDKACQLHPEVSKILASRQQRRTVQQKRKAATSVSGAPGGEEAHVAGVNMRSDIEDAWENAGRA